MGAEGYAPASSSLLPMPRGVPSGHFSMAGNQHAPASPIYGMSELSFDGYGYAAPRSDIMRSDGLDALHEPSYMSHASLTST